MGEARAPPRSNKMARHIPHAQTITEDYFQSSGLVMEYYLDTTLVFQKLTGKCKKLTAYPNHVFKIFGRYTNETAQVVHSGLLDYIKSYGDKFSKCMVVVFTMENISLLEWLSIME